jgi:hypothetical protein
MPGLLAFGRSVVMILRDLKLEEYKDDFDYNPDDDREKSISVDLVISIDGSTTHYALAGWPAYEDSDGMVNPAGYCITSEYGEWIDSGLLYCGIVNRKLIFRWDSNAIEKLGLTKDEPIALEIDDDRIAHLWEMLVKIFSYVENSGITLEFR